MEVEGNKETKGAGNQKEQLESLRTRRKAKMGRRARH